MRHSMRTKVLFHDNCFDGVASAAVFSSFYRSAADSAAEFAYQGLAHRPGQVFDSGLLDAEVNAIVDFKYCSSTSLQWWFDHHQSAFLSEADRKHFEGTCDGRKFYDPSYKSCTKLIGDVAREKFGVDTSALSELIHWADIIDGAQYRDAREALDFGPAAMKLMLVIEGGRDEQFLRTLIGYLQVRKLGEIVSDASFRAMYEPLYERHLRAIEIIKREAVRDGDVVFFDVSEYDIEGYSKFIPYSLFPESLYSISLLKTPLRSKISVGLNPWSGKERRHNLATICEQYGGGGHAVVGAISKAPEELDDARRIAGEIAATLKR